MGIIYHWCKMHKTQNDVFLTAAHVLHLSMCALSYPPTLRRGTVFCNRGPGLRLVELFRASMGQHARQCRQVASVMRWRARSGFTHTCCSTRKAHSIAAGKLSDGQTRMREGSSAPRGSGARWRAWRGAAGPRRPSAPTPAPRPGPPGSPAAAGTPGCSATRSRRPPR